jgi:hypothetical protein
VVTVGRISELLLDDDRRWTLELFEALATVARNAVASEVMSEQEVIVANFHGAERCWNVVCCRARLS